MLNLSADMKQEVLDIRFIISLQITVLNVLFWHQQLWQSRIRTGCKLNKRDAGNIARCLAFHTYSEVHIPTDEDNSIKEYIQMRDDQKQHLKKTKQQILALALRLGKRFEGGKTYWTAVYGTVRRVV